jgi:hypothetical protein
MRRSSAVRVSYQRIGWYQFLPSILPITQSLSTQKTKSTERACTSPRHGRGLPCYFCRASCHNTISKRAENQIRRTELVLDPGTAADCRATSCRASCHNTISKRAENQIRRTELVLGLGTAADCRATLDCGATSATSLTITSAATT